MNVLPSSNAQEQDVRVVVVGPLLFAGLFGVFVVPVEIGALMDGLGFSASRAGILGMVEVGAMSLCSILVSPLLLRLTASRLAILGLAIAVVGELATAGTVPFWSIIIARAAVGVGCGAVFAVSAASCARSRDPDRVMGLGNALSTVLVFIVFLLLPNIQGRFHYRGLFFSFAFVLALTFPAAFLVPPLTHSVESLEVSAVRGHMVYRGMIVHGLGLALLNAGLGALWAFAERIGRSIGLSSEHIDEILSASTLAMIAGAFAAGLLGDRVGRRLPILIGSVACGVAALSVSLTSTALGYAVALSLYNFLYLFVGPYVIAGLPSALDPTGRFSAVAGGIMWMSYSIGVAAGGLIVDVASLLAVGVFALASCSLSAAAFAYVLRYAPSAPRTA